MRRGAAGCGLAASQIWLNGGESDEKFGNHRLRFGAQEPLVTLEIPQNRQSFLWKYLAKRGLDLEILGKKLGGPLFRRLGESPRNGAATA
jgi:hypothetical protein